MIKQKEVTKLVDTYNKKNEYPITNDIFIAHAKRYIKAIKEGRMICSIGTVSRSGMSRTIKFVELAKSKPANKYYMYNFYQLFDVLGYRKIKDSDYFGITGCGMDMIFNTNYNNIHNLHGMGFMNKKTCSGLCQDTPPVV
jgi:hypothetical protein